MCRAITGTLYRPRAYAHRDVPGACPTNRRAARCSGACTSSSSRSANSSPTASARPTPAPRRRSPSAGASPRRPGHRRPRGREPPRRARLRDRRGVPQARRVEGPHRRWIRGAGVPLAAVRAVRGLEPGRHAGVRGDPGGGRQGVRCRERPGCRSSGGPKVGGSTNCGLGLEHGGPSPANWRSGSCRSESASVAAREKRWQNRRGTVSCSTESSGVRPGTRGWSVRTSGPTAC